MSEDIVKRLRHQFPSCHIELEAADEIERLQKLMREIVEAWDWWQEEAQNDMDSAIKEGRFVLSIIKASAALEEKE